MSETRQPVRAKRMHPSKLMRARFVKEFNETGVWLSPSGLTAEIIEEHCHERGIPYMKMWVPQLGNFIARATHDTHAATTTRMLEILDYYELTYVDRVNPEPKA